MALYTAQALILGFLLWCFTLSNRRTDVFIGIYVCTWTVGVIFLYWKFGTAQDIFYSNDQRIQVQMVNWISLHGIEYSIDGTIGQRYLVTIPAYLFSRCGIDSLLALKFLQAIFFVLTYRLVINHFKVENLRFKIRYLVLFTGPIFIFMSLLGLRDLALAYFALYSIIGQNNHLRVVSWCGLFLLRPHLAVALAFGRIVRFAYQRLYPNLNLLFLPLLAVFSFVCGLYAYVIGAHFQSGTGLNFNSLLSVLTQDGFLRLGANFAGLQFLILGSGITELSIVKLLLLRLIFVDTFLVPSLFVWIVITSSKLRIRSVSIFASFAFFLGLVSNTDFNSSRQNIPFLVLMGVTIAEHFALRQRDRNKQEKSAVATLRSDRLLTNT